MKAMDAERSLSLYLKSDLLRAGIIASLLIAPLVILEAVNRSQFREGFPVALFVFMWMLALVGAVVAAPLARSFAAGVIRNRLLVSVGLVLLILVVAVWVTLLRDQMPCFMGVPNCD